MAGSEVIARRTVTTLRALADVLGANTPHARVAIEASREAWYVHDQLVSAGHEVLLVDTTRVRKLGIGNHGRKTDRIDAEVLARAVESGHIPLAHVLSPARRELRVHLAVRRNLVDTRTEHIVALRGVLRAYGVRVPACRTELFHSRVEQLPMESKLRSLSEPVTVLLAALDPQIALMDRKIEQLADKEPIVKLLMTVPGVATIVAAMFVAVIDEAHRFTRAHQVESYLGLAPLEESSGNTRRIGSISKHGNAYLRSLLVQSSWCILRLRDSSDPLRLWANAVAERRGKRIAVIALARRLAGVLWAMWRDGTVYDPAAVGRASARGLASDAQATERRAQAMDAAARKAAAFARRATRRLGATM